MNIIERNKFFLDEARKSFDFLIDLGFAVSPPADFKWSLKVLFVNGDVSLSVCYELDSYQIYADFAFEGSRYDLGALITYCDPDVGEPYRGWMTTTPEGITNGLQQLADLVKKYGIRALRGDREFMRGMVADWLVRRDRYCEEMCVSRIRTDADIAFRARDYTDAAELYSSIRDCLTPVELKKLELSIKYAAQRSHPQEPS